MDDTEHYGEGISDLETIMEELGLGSIASGIAWAKFTAYASDNDENDNNINVSVLPNGITMIGWDIWEDGCINATVPRAYTDTIETLLGKRNTMQDRHTLAARDTMEKIKNLGSRIAIIRTTWD